MVSCGLTRLYTQLTPENLKRDEIMFKSNLHLLLKYESSLISLSRKNMHIRRIFKPHGVGPWRSTCHPGNAKLIYSQGSQVAFFNSVVS